MEHRNMTFHSQLTPICYHPSDISVSLPAWSRHVRRRLHIALFVALAWLAFGSAPLSAQSERDARGIVHSIAGTIYKLAWPTAEYHGITLGELQRVRNGWDIPIILYGKSAVSGGLLWLRLDMELRNGSLYDVRVVEHNAVLRRPFETITDIVIAIREQQRQAAPQTPVASLPIGSQIYFTVGDLSGFSNGQLDILRNEIYARHGRRFRRADLQAYFDRQPWYRPVYAPDAFPERLLSPVERHNVELIANYQATH
jgi:YARHG domain